jgi:hypothetical protein
MHSLLQQLFQVLESSEQNYRHIQHTVGGSFKESKGYCPEGVHYQMGFLKEKKRQGNMSGV